MSLHVVVGGQFGSEAKGAVTAAVTADEVRHGQEVIVVRPGGPNAGHSVIDADGRLWPLRQVPAGMVVDPSVQGVICDGSEVDLGVLADEITRLEAAGHQITDRLLVSSEATVLTDSDKAAEAVDGLVGRIGSTGKGIGAARAARIMRRATRMGDLPEELQIPGLQVISGPALAEQLNIWVHQVFDASVVIEGTQGYGLGLHAGYYPQCTSSDCRAIDFLAMAGINPWGIDPRLMQVHVVVRPYPIRVAGNSGPLAGETSWEELGLKPELTTVTKKVRRVGQWDEGLVSAALAANGPGAKLAVSMIDQVPGLTKELGGGETRVLTPEGEAWLAETAGKLDAAVSWYGVGPKLIDWRRF